MKFNKFVVAVAMCAGMVFCMADAKAGNISTQKSVVPGVWTSDFNAAMEYAEKNYIPMFVFWANTGCSHCEAVETDMNKSAFTTWMAENQIVMVFVEANSTVKSWIKKNAPEKIKAFPYGAIYWPTTNGVQVLEGFSAYKGNMGAYGAKSTDSNIDQLITTLDYLLAGWSPSGDTPSVKPTPVEPTPTEPTVDLAKIYNATKKLEAVAYNDGSLFGKVDISIAKYNSKKGTVKVTVKITSFAGKTYSKSVTVTPKKNGDLLGIELPYKAPVNTIDLSLYFTDNSAMEIEGVGESTSIVPGDVVIGGKLENAPMSLTVDIPNLELENEDYQFVVDLPTAAEAIVSNGTKLNFGKAPTVKYVKYREDGTIWYELKGLDDEEQPNANAIKLTYKYATGALSGSFKLYASNEQAVAAGRKPTLKSYTCKLVGAVVNGAGVGNVTVKVGKKTYTGTFTLD